MSGPEVVEQPQLEIVYSDEYRLIEKRRSDLGELKKLITALSVCVGKISKLCGPADGQDGLAATVATGQSTSFIAALAGGFDNKPSADASSASAAAAGGTAAAPKKKPSATLVSKEQANRAALVAQLEALSPNFSWSSANQTLISKLVSDAASAEKMSETDVMQWSEWARKAGQGVFREQTKLLQDLKAEKQKCIAHTAAEKDKPQMEEKEATPST
jgi:hypothetical protein